MEAADASDALSCATISHFASSMDYSKTFSTADAAIFRHDASSVVTAPSWSDQIVPVAFNPYFAGADPFDRDQHDDPVETIKENSGEGK